jgi:hypothetical protein
MTTLPFLLIVVCVKPIPKSFHDPSSFSLARDILSVIEREDFTDSKRLTIQWLSIHEES